MIPGFNTDIEFEGTVYHVQTEDKGPPSMVILSLVYDGGTILASKRVSYRDVVGTGLDEKQLADRVSRQHKLICAAVKSGRMDELKEMTAKSAAARNGKAVRVEEKVLMPLATGKEERVPAAASSRDNGFVAPKFISRTSEIEDKPLDIAIVDTPLTAEIVPDPYPAEPVVEVMKVIEEEILPAEAVAVVSELSGKERPVNHKLKLELLGESRFKGGDRRTVSIMLCRGTARKVVPDSQIMVKILGSAFRPVIFHAKSDANGLANVHLQVPQFSAGRAALLVRAISDGEEIELRRIITPG